MLNGVARGAVSPAPSEKLNWTAKAKVLLVARNALSNGVDGRVDSSAASANAASGSAAPRRKEPEPGTPERAPRREGSGNRDDKSGGSLGGVEKETKSAPGPAAGRHLWSRSTEVLRSREQPRAGN